MATIGVLEARKTLGSLLDRVENGEEIIITRHGRPVARLTACAEVIDRQSALAAMERLRKRARTLSGGPVTWEILKRDRHMG